MRRTPIVLAALLVTAGGAAAQKRPVTIDDILQLKAAGSPAVSPDGTQVLYTVRQWEPASERGEDRMEARTHLWKVATSGSAPSRQITFGERGDTQPQWSPDGRFISFVSARGAGAGDQPPRPQIYLMSSGGGEAWKLSDATEGVGAYAWAPDSARIAFVSQDPRSADDEAAIKKRDDERVFEGDFRHSHLWTIDVATKTAVRVTEGPSFTVQGAPSWSPDSRRLAFTGRATPMLRDSRSDIYIADVAARTVEKITTNPGADGQAAWSPDGARIALVAELGAAPPIPDGTLPSVIGHGRLMLYDVAARAIKDVSRPDFDFDAGHPHWTADSRRILFTSGRRAFTEVFAYDIAGGTYASLTEKRTLQIGSRSRDGRVYAVTQDSPASPAEIFVTDSSFSSFRAITSTNPQAAQFALGETEVITWKSRDGLEIEGLLLKPVGYEAGRRYPLLTVAHGGPSGAFVNNYRVGGLEGGQLWAGEGWAVFYPNPRGSTNYGEKFLRANINDWGGGDFRDIMTGIDALIARGIADPDRLAHIGWSYGGYMTAWMITQTPRFKAAMVGAGLTNMWSMYGTNDIPNVLISYFGGIPTARTLPLYNERSAMTHVDRVTTPTLILHGGNDERVPIGQPMELFRALKDRGRTVELVFYPREGHGIAEYYHQKDRLTRIRDWVKRYTLGDGTKKTTSQ
jgi:dipeptidyl aminopeptidase/acylaminoacyl peptidase